MMNDSPDSGLTDGTDPTGAADVPGGEAGVNSEQCPQEPAAPARNVPTLWLPDSWAQPLVSAGHASVDMVEVSLAWQTTQQLGLPSKSLPLIFPTAQLQCLPCCRAPAPTRAPTHYHIDLPAVRQCRRAAQLAHRTSQARASVDGAPAGPLPQGGFCLMACMPCLLCSALFIVPAPSFLLPTWPPLPARLLPTTFKA
jgi:hypothetical protein